MDDLGDNLGRGLHIAHLNVRSLMGGHTFDMTKHQIKESGIDIFTLSETWLTEAIPNKTVAIDGYSMVRLDRNWRDPNHGDEPKRGGGVSCYIREGIKFSDSAHANLNTSCKDIEMVWVKLFIKNVRPIVIISVYRPPQGNYKRCCELLSSAFDKANLKDNTDIFILGDFNINFGDKKNPSFKELSFTTQALGLRQLVNSPTRYSFREGIPTNTTLDLIFSNSDCISSTRTLDLNLSDHLAVLVTRKKITLKKEKVEFKGRSYRNYDREAFQERLLNENWVPFFGSNDPNEQWDLMQGIIKKVIDPMCPLKSFKVKEIQERWITNEAIEEIRDKDRALYRAKRSGREEDWAYAKRLRNRVGRGLENLRADYLKNQQEANKGDPKNFWKAISTLVPNQKAKSSTIWLRDETTGSNVPQDRTAGFINKFFTNIGPDLASHHTNEWEYFGDTAPVSIDQVSTDTDEVLKLCKEINPLKSSGLDEISSKICKDAFLVLSEQLVHMFNTSLLTAIFPDAWKIAKVVPLFKGGDREKVGNYRPVSLLPLPGKLLERIVHCRVTQFWDDIKFLTQDQGGFRKGFSTLATIADLTDDLFTQINDGNTTVAAFIDLRKAFDTVNLKILLKKLQKSGIRHNLLEWCRSYLTNRHQRTMANGLTSNLLRITCGVPQGSVLGPLFFLVYVNDVQSALDECNVKLYADDTVLYQSGLNSHEASVKLQASLNHFVNWCSTNQLTINIQKTKVMVFGSRHRVKKAKNVDIRINNDRLKLVPSYRYLGMSLDSTLNYNVHIASVLRTLLHKLSLLGKMKRYLNNDVALSIYRSMLLPYFDYADAIYDNSNAIDLNKLQRLQNKCLRVCLGRDRRFSTEAAHKKANVPFLADRRKAHTLNFMYKRKDRTELLNLIQIRTRAHDAPLFKVIVPRCEAFKRSVGYAGAVSWNSLPPMLRNTDSYLAFKAIQKKTMLHPLSLIEIDM